MQKGEISSIGQIFSHAFRLYARRILPYTAVTILGYLFTALVLAGSGIGIAFALGWEWPELQAFFNNDVQQIIADPSLLMTHRLALPVLGAGAALLLMAFLLICWTYTASLVIVIDEQQGIIEALCTGWKYLLPVLWISSLYVGIISTGFFFLIIPGIVLTLSLSFYSYSMIDEDRTGLAALMASRLYMRGHWWNTFIKLLLMLLTVIALSVPLELLPLFIQFPGQRIIIEIMFYFISTFFIFYMAAVYFDLKQAAGRIDPDSTWHCLWMPMALIGIMLPLLGLIGAFVVAGPNLPSELQQIREQVLQQLRQYGVNISLPPPATESAPESSAVPPVRELSSVDGFIIWRDPAGDTRNPFLDIKEVSAKGQEEELRLTVTLAQPAAAYFTAENQADFDSLISFYFDADMNPATGNALAEATDRIGYDFQLDVLLVSADGTGQAYASLHALSPPQQRQPLESLADEDISLTENSIYIRLPYSRINAAANTSIKACFREAAQLEGAGLANEQEIPLQ